MKKLMRMQPMGKNEALRLSYKKKGCRKPVGFATASIYDVVRLYYSDWQTVITISP